MTAEPTRVPAPDSHAEPMAQPSAGGPSRLAALDGLRGLAAFAVFLWHTLDVFWPAAIGSQRDAGGAPCGQAIAAVLHAVPLGWTANGAFAVSLFFALSGFVLTQATYSAVGRGTVHELVAQRVLRLLPMVVVGSVVAWLVLRWQLIGLDQIRALNGCTDDRVYPAALVQNPSVKELVAQVLVRVWRGSEGLFGRVLWTIGTELKGSVLLFVFLPLFGRLPGRWLSYAVMTYLGVILMGLDFLYFIVGSLLASLHRDRALPAAFSRAPVQAALLAYGLVVGGLSPWARVDWFAGVHLGPFPKLLAQALAAGALIVAVLTWRPVGAALSTRPVQFLGRVSYALYAIHQPLLYSLAVAVALWLAGGVGYDLAAAVGAAATCAVVLALSWVLAVAVDQPANLATKALVRRLLSPTRDDAPARQAETPRPPIAVAPEQPA